MNKNRKFIIVLALIILISALVMTLINTSRNAPRPLLSPEDTVSSILRPGSFIIFQYYDGDSPEIDVTHLVDMDELFALLSQTEIQRGNHNNIWRRPYFADWLFWNMGGSYNDSLRGRTIAFWGSEGGMFAEVSSSFRSETFSLSNADEIVAFLERSIAES